jgi:hypothetical protein
MATALGARANVEIAGISTWEVRDSGTDQTWYTIPFLKNGKVQEEDAFVLDKDGRQRVYARKCTVSGDMIATGSATNCLGILDSIADQLLDFKVTGKAGAIWDSAGATGDGAGLNWELVSDSDMNDVRYLTIIMDRIYLPSESDAFHTAQSNTETGTDAELAKLESIAVTDIAPAGLRAIGFGVGNYTDYTVTHFRNSKFRAKTLSSPDQYGRSIAHAVHVTFEAEVMGVNESVEIPAADSLSALSDVDWKLTFADGRIASFDSLLGISLNITNAADSDDIQTMKLMAEGKMTLAAFAALWS